MTIYKFILKIVGLQTIFVPAGAKLLDVQMQGDRCCLWALVTPGAPERPRQIAILGTGEPMCSAPGDYIATVQMNGGALVLHVFETR